MEEREGVEEGDRDDQREKMSCNVIWTTVLANCHGGPRMGKIA